MTELSPVTVEQAIRACSERIAKGVMVCDERYRAFLQADHAYDVAFAADAAYRYADRQARALESELRAWQSVNKSMVSMYGAVGVTER